MSPPFGKPSRRFSRLLAVALLAAAAVMALLAWVERPFPQGKEYPLSWPPEEDFPVEMTITLPGEYDLSWGVCPSCRATHLKERGRDLSISVYEGGSRNLFTDRSGDGFQPLFHRGGWIGWQRADWLVSSFLLEGKTRYCAETIVDFGGIKIKNLDDLLCLRRERHDVHVYIHGSNLEEVVSSLPLAGSIRFIR